MMTFNEKFVSLRKSGGYTQENPAEKLGVSKQAVARWEACETTPDINMLLKICDTFNVSANYMIHDSYKSDEDIPAVKEKNNTIAAAKRAERRRYAKGCLFACVIGIIGALYASYVIVTNESIQIKMVFAFFTVLNIYGSVRRIRDYFEIHKQLKEDTD